MMKFFKQKNISRKDPTLPKGFTLVETLVAIAIFTISVIALMSVLASGIANTTYSKQKLTASYLAQEGIEYIRNIRDTSVLYNTTSGQAGWNAFMSSVNSASCVGVGCYINNMNLVPCNSGVCPNLFYNITTGSYGYGSGSGSDSGFNRKITITQPGSAPFNEIKVSSTVSWTQGSGTYSITLSENLFNWVE